MGTSSIRTELTKKVYDAMKNDTDVNDSVGGRISEFVCQDTLRPYIEIANITAENIDSHTNESYVGQVTIKVWSEYKGSKESNDILDKLNILFNNIDIGLECFTTISFKNGFSDVQKDPDGYTYMGITRYDYSLGG